MSTMTAQEQSTLRALLVHTEVADADSHSAYRLLNQLGHDVHSAATADEAVEMLQNDRADLVIVDSDDSGRRDFVTRLMSLPTDQQPLQIAIFSDALDEALAGLTRQLQRSRVHVLLKPLHMHGLLGMLRAIESKA
jgi:DNA-binding response OmpR family regulator